MIPQAESIYNNMQEALKVLPDIHLSPIMTCEQSFPIVREAILKLEEIASEGGPFSEEEQVMLYKNTSPYYYEKHLYFLGVYQLETAKPLGDVKHVKKYYQRALKKLIRYQTDDKEFLQYIRAGHTYMDSLYFTRRSQENLIPEYFDAAVNTNLFTRYSLKMAEVASQQQLVEYLNTVLTERKDSGSTTLENMPRVEWTDSKTGLIELIYAWKERGSFNNGHLTIQQSTEYLEKVFNVSLGNTSRTYQQTLFRKSGPASYLEELKKDAEKRAERLA